MGISSLKRTPILVLFVLLGAVGISAAYAVGTITLTGDVAVTDDFTVDTDTLVVDSANDRIGIGITNPSASLHISSADPRITLTDSPPAGLGGFIRFTGQGIQSATIVYNSDTDKLFFEMQPDGNSAIVLDSIGNVGIGTPPSEQLDVGGNILARDDIFVGTLSSGDDDTIWFDFLTNEFLKWDEAADNFFISDELIASPIVGSWRPDSGTSSAGAEFVKWDIEEENTNSNYLGFIAGTDSIQIKKSGYYRVSVHVYYTNLSDGDIVNWKLTRTLSDGIFDENICLATMIAAGSVHSSSCSAIEFFNDNDKVKLEDFTTAGVIFGSLNPGFEDLTFLNIERLN